MTSLDLTTHGVTVVPNILTAQECYNAYSGIWQFYHQLSGGVIQAHDTSTWHHYYQYLPKHAMLQQHFHIGHCQAAWDVRQHPRVAGVYTGMYQCQPEDLIASFDGVSLHLPPEITGKGWYKGDSGPATGTQPSIHDWLHVDQAYTDTGFRCVQSYVNLLDTQWDDATTTVLLGSHLLHDEVRQRFGITDTSRFFKLAPDMIQYYLSRGCVYHRITAPAGAMVAWDSRTVHCGSEPLQSRSRPTTRAVVYVCYMPRAYATEKQLQKKRDAFQNYRMTSHWPLETLLFGHNPQTYGKPLPPTHVIPAPQLSPLGWRLAGF